MSEKRSLRASDLYAGIEAHRPKSAMIEIADRCNEVCVHCYQIQGQKGEMSTEEVLLLLERLAADGVLLVTISGGEATLRKDFREILQRASDLDFAIKLMTNGVRVDASLADFISQQNVIEVQISLYASKAAPHDWVTGVRGSFVKTCEGIRLLSERGVRVIVANTVMKSNVDDLEAWFALVTSLGGHPSPSGHVFAREGDSRDPEVLNISAAEDEVLGHRLLALESAALDALPSPVAKARLEDIHESVQAGRKAGFKAPAADALLDRRPCGACTSSVHIEADGKIHPCIRIDTSLGSAKEPGSVVDKMLSHPTTELFKTLTWGRLRGCRVCDLRLLCTRCFADSRLQSGDALAPYERACRSAVRAYAARLGEVVQLVNPPGDAEAFVGPFRHLGEHRFERFEDLPVEGNEDAYAALPWLRTEAVPAPEDQLLAPGSLVRVRRPGRAEREERIPE